jgi:hypothetical protein
LCSSPNMGCNFSKRRDHASYQVASAIADAIVRAGDPDAIDLERMCELRVPHEPYPEWHAARADAAVALLVERMRAERLHHREADVMLCLLLIAYVYGLREGCTVEINPNDCVTVAPIVKVGTSDIDRSSCQLRRTHRLSHCGGLKPPLPPSRKASGSLAA